MDIKKILKICFLIVIEFIFCFTPIGSIPIGPIVATLAMIPVIITSLVFGKKIGMILGLITGTFSFIYWTFLMPAYPTAFLFTPFSESAGYKGNVGSLIICFLPRILTGLVPALIFGQNINETKKDSKNITIRKIIASVLGSLTNTVLVLFFIFIFFGKEYATILDNSILIILGTAVLTNGIPEAIVAGILCPIVANAIKNI